MLERIKKAHQNVVNGRGPEKYKDFLESLRYFYESKGKITHAQESYLISIENHWSDTAVMEEATWMEQYNDDLRDIAVKCALYYKQQIEQYFGHTVTKVLNDREGHILSKREFTKMCMNKYAQKVIAEYSSECKFSVGELVALRASNSIHLVNKNVIKYTNTPSKLGSGLVLEQNAKPISRACKGAKVYKVKFVGRPGPLFVCEADIKKLRRKKK